MTTIDVVKENPVTGYKDKTESEVIKDLEIDSKPEHLAEEPK